MYTSSGDRFVIDIYVDTIIASNTESNVKQNKNDLQQVYKIKDLGELNPFFGVNIVKSDGNCRSVGQSNFTKALLSEYGRTGCKSSQTPVTPGVKLINAGEEEEPVDVKSIGSLLHLSLKTRPDITIAVNQAAEFCFKPFLRHWRPTK